jgi:DNA/RNA endonuclease G (NUC1)
LNFWITGKEFNIRGTPTNITSIKCTETPQSEIEHGGWYDYTKYWYDIGFQLMNGDFIRLIEVCFDRYYYTPLYTKFTIVNGVDMEHQTGDIPEKLKKDYFNYITPSVEDAYKERSPSHSREPVLEGGHLAAWADFTYYSQRLATQYYINVVPQWNTFNGGNWRTLEERIRKMARENNTDLVVYAGSCSPSNEVDTDSIYLAVSKTTGGLLVPVPEQLFRIVYNQNTKHSVVFLGINSVHTNTSISQHRACEENYQELESFIKGEPFFKGFDRKDITKGYIYCCRLTDFLDSCDRNNSPLSYLPLQ